jgi:hypothetical protein
MQVLLTSHGRRNEFVSVPDLIPPNEMSKPFEDLAPGVNCSPKIISEFIDVPQSGQSL